MVTKLRAPGMRNRCWLRSLNPGEQLPLMIYSAGDVAKLRDGRAIATREDTPQMVQENKVEVVHRGARLDGTTMLLNKSRRTT